MATAAAAWCDEGQAWIVDLLLDKEDAGSRASGSMKWVNWGSGAVTADPTDTALGAEHPEARIDGTVSEPSANVYRVVGEQTATANRSVEEAGVFNQSAAAGDVIWARATFALLNIETGDRAEFTFDTTFADFSEV